jgi:hypothetical protein
MSVDAIKNHIDATFTRLLSQFSGRPNLSKVITSIGNEVQRFEDAAIPLQTDCLLANAVGAQLDGIGSVVGQPRNSMPDILYKLFLLGRIASNSSKATQETILNLTKTLFQASAVSLRGSYTPGNGHLRAPMVIGLEVGSPQLPSQYFSVALTLIRQSLAAGVELGWVSVFSDDAFALAGPTGGLGLASDDGTVAGGQLASNLFTSTLY